MLRLVRVFRSIAHRRPLTDGLKDFRKVEDVREAFQKEVELGNEIDEMVRPRNPDDDPDLAPNEVDASYG